MEVGLWGEYNSFHQLLQLEGGKKKKKDWQVSGQTSNLFYSSSSMPLRQGSFYQLLWMTCHHPTHRVNTSLPVQLDATLWLT